VVDREEPDALDAAPATVPPRRRVLGPARAPR
jgi:hypothetical protein